MELLVVMCEAGLDSELQAGAVADAFSFLKSLGYDLALNMIEMLIQKGASGPRIDDILILATVEDERLDILRVLLQHGTHGQHGLRGGVSHDVLTDAFNEVRRTKPRWRQLKLMDLLLTRAASLDNPEIGQSQSLPQETNAKLNYKINGLELLLQYYASVDFNNGEALRMAATAGSGMVVGMLLSAGASPETVLSAVEDTINARLTSNQQYDILCQLLRACPRIPSTRTTQALARILHTKPNHTRLVEPLLEHGAAVSPDSLLRSLAIGSKKLVQMLASRIDSSIATEVFRHLRVWGVESSKKLWVYGTLLAKGVSAHEVSEALIDSLRDDPQDLDTPKLLLEHNAAVGHRDGISVWWALSSGDIHTFTLLCQFIDPCTVNVVFKRVMDYPFLESDSLHQAYTTLLQLPIDQKLLDAALEDVIKRSQRDDTAETRDKTVRLLLNSGANPNSNHAACIVLTCNRVHEATFRALCQYSNLEEVLPNLIANAQHASEATEWVGICLLETPGQPREIKNTGLLLQC
jgi:hypothetical protein